MSREKDAWEATWSELSAASDRAAGILGQAILEEYLRDLLVARLVDTPETTRLLAPGGRTIALTKLAALAHCMGLITQQQLEQMRAIVKIRNHFAHNLDAASFDDRAIAEPLSHLDSYADLLGNRAHTTRNLFTGAIAFLVYVLIVETAWAEHLSKREERVDLLDTVREKLGLPT